MKKIIALFSFILITILVQAQVISVYPSFPNDQSACTIYFHADEGDLGLKDFTGDVYIHTGVVTSVSPNNTSWQHVVTTWASTNVAFKMTQLSANLYSFYIPNIRTYYNVTNMNETIYRLAMVFRNGDGSIKGKNVDGSDIFYDLIIPGEFEGAFFSPSSATLLELNDSLNVTYGTSANANLSFTDNGNALNSFTNTDSVTFTYHAATYGSHWIKATAFDGTNTIVDSIYLMVRPPVEIAALPAGSKIGINYLNDSTARLVLCAPNKNYVYVIGEFNNWLPTENTYMKHTPDNNYWWVNITGLTAGQEYAYQYFVDGILKVADPYCDKLLDNDDDPYINNVTYPNLKPYPTGKTSGNVSVLQTAQAPFQWQVNNFVKPSVSSLVIYELLLRDFIGAHDWQTMIDTLNYLKTLGVNAIELMPVNEFEGNNSWGYNPSFYFAPDKYYGTKEKLKEFIDYCHQNGIAVLMDIALNHSFGQSPYVQMYWDAANNKPSIDNPWFNPDAKHPFNVGYDMNHESPFTKKYFSDITKYWINEYKIDGYRFDLAKGFTQTNSGSNVSAWGNYDASRINIWYGYNDSIRSASQDAYLILEFFGSSQEEKELANHGFMLWGNGNHNYTEAAMGYTDTDFGWSVSYKQRGWNDPHLVGFMESHDEERMMYKCLQFGNVNGSYSVKDLNTALFRMGLCANLFITVPGPKMLWEFGELGYDITKGGNTDPKPIKWNYYQQYARYRLFRTFASLIQLKKTYPAFSSNTYYTNFSGYYKQLQLIDPSMNVVALGNFDVVATSPNATFPHTGIWYNYYNGYSLNVTSTNMVLNLAPGDFKLYTDVQLPLPNLGVGVSDESMLNEDMIFDIYPNPVAENASLTFYISKDAAAKLELYDLSGKMIKILYTNEHAVKGFYETALSNLNLSCGTYLVKLISGNNTATKKIIIQ